MPTGKTSYQLYNSRNCTHPQPGSSSQEAIRNSMSSLNSTSNMCCTLLKTISSGTSRGHVQPRKKQRRTKEALTKTKTHPTKTSATCPTFNPFPTFACSLSLQRTQATPAKKPGLNLTLLPTTYPWTMTSTAQSFTNNSLWTLSSKDVQTDTISQNTLYCFSSSLGKASKVI